MTVEQKQNIILASSSKERRMFMEVLNIPFEAVPADIDEYVIRDSDLAVRVEKIARAKAEAVAKLHGGIIIASDCFGEHNGKVYEKPKTTDEAREMLHEQSGTEGKLYSGFCYLDRKSGVDYSKASVIDVRLRKFSDAEIEAMVKTLPVLRWAGAMSPAYPYGATMIASIKGSFTGFIHGLPMEELIPLLRKSGFDVHP